ncbi:N-acetylmuramoyl-L-alanine amidase [Candidatus Magnetomoraceae bacterium gMMP-15]
MIFSNKNKIILVSLLFFLLPCISIADISAKDKYYEADLSYKKLKKDPVKKQYREYWFEYIKKFHNVYKHNPKGPWAAASLYKAGYLYYELYQYSHNREHLKEAEDHFKQVIKKFPKSKYSRKSTKIILKMYEKFPLVTDLIAACSCLKKKAVIDNSKDNIAKDMYFKAEFCTKKLQVKSKLKKADWLDCIDKFYNVYKFDPAGRWAAAGLYQAGFLYYKFYKYSSDKKHFLKAENYMKKLITNFPESKYCIRSAKAVKKMRAKYMAGSVYLKKKNIRKIRRMNNEQVKELYFKADKCYKELKNSVKSEKENEWISCINKFYNVYKYNPKGRWASAGLYKAGLLYYRLYQRTKKSQHLKEAKDYFNRVINRFPESRYSFTAEQKLQEIKNKQSIPKKSDKTLSSKKILYKKPLFTKKKIKDIPKTKTSKTSDKKIAKKEVETTKKIEIKTSKTSDKKIAKKEVETSKTSDKSLLTTVMNLRLKTTTDHTRVVVDADKKILYKKPLFTKKKIKDIPKTKTSKTSDKKIAKKEVETTKKIEIKTSKTSDKKIAKKEVETSKTSDKSLLTTVMNLRLKTKTDHTRVVVDADKKMDYKHKILKKDAKNPNRIYVDLNNAKLSKSVKSYISINDRMIRNIRTSQHNKDSVRVVLDLKNFKTYKIFSLNNPFRIVIDVWEKTQKSDKNKTKYTASLNNVAISQGAIAKQLALGVKRIVIDAGHGGKDSGAPGCINGIQEKDLVLSISKKLAKQIKGRLKCEVIMTRTKDKFLSLEKRTAIANQKNADLFISIHTNAHPDQNVYGIETYFLNLATDNEAIRVAALENASSGKNLSDLEKILQDLMHNAKINESSRLAGYVQHSMHKNLKKKYNSIKNNGVKQAPFYVLMGAKMPSILIETGFISNKTECNRLNNKTYQDRLCDAIINGIKKYIMETNPTAFRINPYEES